MNRIDPDRFLRMAECYDRVAAYLVPQYAFLQRQALDLLAAGLPEGPRWIVDLGAGSGILLEKALQRWPKCRAVWVDSSKASEAVARRRLADADAGGRVVWVRSRLEEAWERHIPAAPDAVVSMSAIHHLASGDKRSLCARCFEALPPGGWFVNVDEMSTFCDDAYEASLHQWVGHVESVRPTIPPELRAYADEWCAAFDNWKLRNIERRHEPKAAGDDIHEPFAEQVAWLADAGFVLADVYVKFHLWSMVAGQRPVRS